MFFGCWLVMCEYAGRDFADWWWLVGLWLFLPPPCFFSFAYNSSFLLVIFIVSCSPRHCLSNGRRAGHFYYWMCMFSSAFLAIPMGVARPLLAVVCCWHYCLRSDGDDWRILDDNSLLEGYWTLSIGGIGRRERCRSNGCLVVEFGEFQHFEGSPLACCRAVVGHVSTNASGISCVVIMAWCSSWRMYVMSLFLSRSCMMIYMMIGVTISTFDIFFHPWIRRQLSTIRTYLGL